MDNKNINSYQGVIMKEMTLDRMGMIEGGAWTEYLCIGGAAAITVGTGGQWWWGLAFNTACGLFLDTGKAY